MTSQSALVFVTAMLVTGSSYVALISVPGLPQSSMTATSTSTFSIVGSTDGFPRESNGGWMVHTVGSDPTPEGCRNLVAATFHEGYSLKTYLSSNAVKAGGLVCVDIVLQHVNGTVVTWGRSDELITGFNVTNSSGQVLDSLTCIPTVPPLGQGPGADVPRPVSGCSSVWDTSVSNLAGVVPRPGTYHIIASASYPGIGANTSATARSSTVVILP